MASPSGPSPFRHTVLPRAAQQLRGFVRLAQQRGLSADFARDVRAIRTRLGTDPGVWGDQLFNYHKLQLSHYRGLSQFLFTYYSVNFAAQQVFVQSFAVRPYSRLA